MFCSKCGNQLPDDATFCPRCGAKLSQEPATVSTPAEPQKSKADSVAPEPPKKKKSKKLPILLGVAVALFFIFVIFPGMGENEQPDVTPVNTNGVNLSETYTNAEEGFSFKYPSGWKLVSEERLAEVADGTEGDYPLVMLANEVEDLPEEDSFIMVSKFDVGQDYIDHLFIDDEQFAATFDGNASIKDTSVIELDGVPTRKITYTKVNDPFGYESYFYGVGSSIYRIDFTWIGETSGNKQVFFDAIIGSYKITLP